MSTGKKRWLMGLAVLAVFAGAFSVGGGLSKIADNRKLRSSYPGAAEGLGQAAGSGADIELARDWRNQLLAANMEYVSINRELIFADGSAEAEAGIAVEPESAFGCIVTVIRDATGEQLYRSGVIDPGHYIGTIHLKSCLKKGYYPCTAVWSYYTAEDKYVGETAWKVVVIIDQ